MFLHQLFPSKHSSLKSFEIKLWFCHKTLITKNNLSRSMTKLQNLHICEKPTFFTSSFRLKVLKGNSTICGALHLDGDPTCSVTWPDGYKYTIHIHIIHPLASVNLPICPRWTSFSLSCQYDSSKNPRSWNYSRSKFN